MFFLLLLQNVLFIIVRSSVCSLFVKEPVCMYPRARRRQKEGLEIQETSFLSQLEATGHTLEGRQTKTGRKLSKNTLIHKRKQKHKHK